MNNCDRVWLMLAWVTSLLAFAYYNSITFENAQVLIFMIGATILFWAWYVMLGPALTTIFLNFALHLRTQDNEIKKLINFKGIYEKIRIPKFVLQLVDKAKNNKAKADEVFKNDKKIY